MIFFASDVLADAGGHGGGVLQEMDGGGWGWKHVCAGGRVRVCVYMCA